MIAVLRAGGVRGGFNAGPDVWFYCTAAVAGTGSGAE